MASVTMASNQKFTVVLQPLDAANNPGQIDGPPTWTVDTPGVVTLQISSDGLTAVVLGEAAGTCNITPSATSGGGANSISGAPINVSVTEALNPATQLAENIGPVTNQ